jgi:hypothetical protein
MVYYTAEGRMMRLEVELVAMKAVMDIETALGYTPRDVGAEKC